MMNPFRRRPARQHYPELMPLQGFPRPDDALPVGRDRTDALQRRVGDWFWRG